MKNPYLPQTPPTEQPLRAWPGVLIALFMVTLMTVPGLLMPRTSVHFMSLMFGSVLAFVFGAAWWYFGARVTGRSRWIIPVLWLVLMAGFSMPEALAGHPPMSSAIFGWPFQFAVFALVVLGLWVVGRQAQLTGAYVATVLAWAAFALVRIEGTDAELTPSITWAWTPRPEAVAKELDQRTLGKIENVEVKLSDADWPQFRGTKQDGIVRGKQNFDFSTEPKQVWKQAIGPGWGTFSVVGNRLFTQEQRGENEAVVCYNATNGEELWRFYDKALFRETISSVGPRATPTYHNGQLFVQGTTGYLYCLNAETGEKVWRVGLLSDAGAKVPEWGLAGSPTVLNDLVYVYTGAGPGKGITALSKTSGSVIWQSGNATHGYSSVHITELAGRTQLLFVSNYGLEAFDPVSGEVLWDYPELLPNANRVTQPMILGYGELLFTTGVGQNLGATRLKVESNGSGFRVSKLWFTNKLKPYFNDGVQLGGYYYGFDDKSLVCVDLKTGHLKWNAGTKYAHGQLLLLEDAGLLVVVGVDGRVSLVKADPAEYSEELSFKGISGKTWNHPVYSNGKLYLRNSTEAACYEFTPTTKDGK
jgi:outer membrane protein assembly factor BamB